MITENRPRVGVGVIITNNNKFLLLKRKGSHGSGTWAFIGGHLEFNESLEDCARRETKEEIGISIKNVKPVAFTNDFFLKENKHYIKLFVQAEPNKGTIKNMEPEKCDELKWFEWDKFPSPLFQPIKNLRKQVYNLLPKHKPLQIHSWPKWNYIHLINKVLFVRNRTIFTIIISSTSYGNVRLEENNKTN